MASRLHLPSLTVEGFRGIRALELPEFGRVTLLAGKNSIGKTAILEAVRLFASRGDHRTLYDLLDNREEFVTGSDENGDETVFPDFASLFHGHDPDNDDKHPPTIRISARPAPHGLSLQLVDADERRELPSLYSEDTLPKDLRVSVGKRRRNFPVRPMGYYERFGRRYYPSRVREGRNPDAWPDPIVFESVGPGLPDNDKVTRLWDEVVLTRAEEFVTKTLRLVVGDKLERLAVIGDPDRLTRTRGRRVVATLNPRSIRIPLKRLGDGAQRLLGIAVALANCRNGILLIDEVENGIHHSIQPEFWHMIFSAAKESNVQVVAATHSWDCIASFATAANETPEVGTLIRLERFGDDLDAIHYSEEDLETAARQRIEVR